MGRPKGSKSKTEDAKAFVAYVERALAKGANKDNLVNLVCRHIRDEKVPTMLLRTLEMKFGKPVQPQEHTGPNGETLRIIVEHIGSADSSSAQTE
jgi:hypothetical protein